MQEPKLKTGANAPLKPSAPSESEPRRESTTANITSGTRRDMQRHLDIVAALHLGLGLLGVLLAALALVVFSAIGIFSQDEHTRPILMLVGCVTGCLLFLLSAPGIIGGIGLFKRKNWARILVLVVSAIDLLNFPIGTALGAYSIWVLVQPECGPQLPPRVPSRQPDN